MQTTFVFLLNLESVIFFGSVTLIMSCVVLFMSSGLKNKQHINIPVRECLH